VNEANVVFLALRRTVSFVDELEIVTVPASTYLMLVKSSEATPASLSLESFP